MSFTSYLYFSTSSLFNPVCFICSLPVAEMEETQKKGELVMQIVIVIEYQRV